MQTLFFLHVPKTGGTSLREAALRLFGPERVLLIYGEDSRNTSEAVKAFFFTGARLRKRLKLLSRHIAENDIRFVASHVYTIPSMRGFDPARALTLLRDPVERVISNYEFNVAKQGLTGVSLEQYVEEGRHRNVQSKILSRVDLVTLGAVGVTEHYDEFVDYLALVFDLRLEKLKRNSRNWLGKGLRKTIPGEMRGRIERLNPDDMELYERALAIWRANSGLLRRSA